MKKYICLILVVTMLSSFLGGCQKTAPESEGVPSEITVIVTPKPEPDDEINNPEQNNEDPDNKVKLLLTGFDMSDSQRLLLYDEYFSEVRPFDWEERGYTTSHYWEHENGLLLAVPKNLGTNPEKQIEAQVIAEVEDYLVRWPTDQEGYFISDGYLCYASIDGSVVKKLYRPTGNITEIVGNSELVFFVEDQNVYRIHLKSGILDYICNIGDGDRMRPYDSVRVMYHIQVGTEIVDGREEPKLKILCFNSLTGEITDPPDDYYEKQYMKGTITDPEIIEQILSGLKKPDK